MLGWHIVNIFLWVNVVWFPIGLILQVIHYSGEIPFSGFLLGALGECVKLGILLWILFRFWIPKKREFEESSSSPNPTAGTT